MAAVQNRPTSPTQSRTKKSPLVTEPPKFDLESYVQNYQGRTKLERLLHIGASSTFLGAEALKSAVNEAKAGKDIRLYAEAWSLLEVIAPSEPEAVRDDAWISTVDRHNQAETARLEAELKGYKNNLIKESIRMGNEDLGKHYQSIGDLPKAFEAFARMRQDVSIPKHIVDVSKHLIEVGIEQRNWIAVLSNVQKIKTVQSSSPDDISTQQYLAAAEGLATMDSEQYYNAALSFLSTETGMGASCNTIISPNDIAVYGGLCALASMGRNELHKRVLENSHFRTYLELEPHIRRAINFFVNSRYTACLDILDAYRADYLLDVHLHKHVENLYYLIRSKSIVQYFIPFSCVTLESLNAAFAPPGKSIEKELSMMILRNQLDARIDTQNKLLTSTPSAPRSAMQSEALKTAKEFEREARRRIQHMNIASADLDMRHTKKSGALDDLLDNGLLGSNHRELRPR